MLPCGVTRQGELGAQCKLARWHGLGLEVALEDWVSFLLLVKMSRFRFPSITVVTERERWEGDKR